MNWEEKFSKGFHVEEATYFTSPEHRLIGLGNIENISLQNIGKNGCNLTIAVLSMNRSSLTIRMMDSITKYIPNFEGEFLIGDNGSVETEKAILKAAMKRMPYRCRMLEFDKNYGVAGGRNRLFAEVKTEWILSADNDLYFVNNPLRKIQEDIAQLGCHFLSVPIINKDSNTTGINGGHLYIENIRNKVSAGGGSVFLPKEVKYDEEYPPFLCTFLPGGAAVLKKDTFFECGGFDGEMFVGFEDTEFSVRLFQKGYKIGSCGMACIIHDHPKPEKNVDKDYEKRRFSTNYIAESGKHFERKHGFSVWNPAVENWVENRLSDLLGNGEKKNQVSELKSEKPKIALVIDKEGWAFDNIAAQITDKLGDFYEFKKIYLSDFDNLIDILLLAEDCKVIHFFWRPLAGSFYDSCSKQKLSYLGMTNDDFYKKYILGKCISVAVYDHLLLDGEERIHTEKLFSDNNSIVNSYTVSSLKLKKIYEKDERIIMKPTAVTPDGVDLSLFKPHQLERFRNMENRTIRIGWVGNSKWQVSDLKGINTIIRPAIEILKKQGYDVELVTSDRQNKMIPHDKMPEFYAGIDLYICASIYEGTPNPVLESMACGVPVISTDVGLVPECFGNLQKEFILESRSVKCLVDKLKYLLDRKEVFAELSDENLTQIMCWDWKIIVQNFKRYFEDCLKINNY